MSLKVLFISLLITASSAIQAQELTVMSYNIHHGRNQLGQIDLDSIAAVIKASGAEIVGLQEVDSVVRRSGNVDQMKVLAALTGMHYTFRKHFDYGGGAYGLGILSKYPVSKTYEHRITSFTENPEEEKTLVFLAADVLTGTDTIYFATVHFDYRRDPAVRMKQSGEVLDITRNINYPVILTGDLNAEPEKKEISQLSDVFADTDHTGKFTFPSELPVKKIDYILVSKPHLQKVISHHVINESHASDHRPVLSTVVLK